MSAVGGLAIGAAGNATLTHTGGTFSAQNVIVGDGVANTPTATVAALHIGATDTPGVFNARSMLSVRGGTFDVNGPVIVDAGGTLEVSGPTLLVNVPGPVGTATNGAFRSTGDILVADGTVSVDGGTGTIQAGLSGTTIAGTGTINANISILTGAVLAPGNALGNLTLNGNLTFDGAVSSFAVEIQTDALYDSLSVSGGVTLANATLTGSMFGSPIFDANDLFFIIRKTGADPVTGIFNGLADGSTVMLGGYPFQISYDADFLTSSFDTGGNDVALKALVPEPASFALVGVGAALFLARRRRREE